MVDLDGDASSRAAACRSPATRATRSRETELSLVCVGTPSAPNGSQDQTAMLRLARGSRRGDARQVAGARIRVPLDARPARSRTCCADRRERVRARRTGIDFHVCFQPEFLREGSSIRDYDKPPFTIVGANGEAAGSELRDRSGTSVRVPTHVDSRRRDGQVLLQQFPRPEDHLRQRNGPAVRGDGRRSVRGDGSGVQGSPAQHLAGVPEAGLRVRRLVPAQGPARDDVLRQDARRRAADARAASCASNRVHIDHAIAKVMATGKRRIGMIGLSFKTGTDDLRESPLVLLAEHFIGKGLSLLVYDPEVHLSSLLGANRRFIEQHVPHIGAGDTRRTSQDVLAESDVLVVGLSDRLVFEALRRHVRPDHVHSRSCEHPRRQGVARAACRVVLVTHGRIRRAQSCSARRFAGVYDLARVPPVRGSAPAQRFVVAP